MRATSSWRTTSSAVNVTWPMPSTSASRRIASDKPEVWPLADVEGIGHVTFTAEDVVRHELVARIVRAYDNAAAAKKRGAPE